MHGAVQQSEQAMRLLTMIMHFHCAVTESPGAIFTEISQRRWCYVTAAMDPAVHITNASHCDGVTCFIQATSRRQQQQRSSCYYSLASVTQDHAEPCSSHTATTSTEQPCSAHRHSSFHFGLSDTTYRRQCVILPRPFSSSTHQQRIHYIYRNTLMQSSGISTGQPNHTLRELCIMRKTSSIFLSIILFLHCPKGC